MEPISVGNLYCNTKMGTWTLVTDIWIDETETTRLRIHDKLFPSVGRSMYDAYHTPESEKRTVTKDEFIDYVVITGLGLMTTDARDVKIQTEDELPD